MPSPLELRQWQTRTGPCRDQAPANVVGPILLKQNEDQAVSMREITPIKLESFGPVNDNLTVGLPVVPV